MSQTAQEIKDYIADCRTKFELPDLKHRRREHEDLDQWWTGYNEALFDLLEHLESGVTEIPDVIKLVRRSNREWDIYAGSKRALKLRGEGTQLFIQSEDGGGGMGPFATPCFAILFAIRDWINTDEDRERLDGGYEEILSEIDAAPARKPDPEES